MKLRERGETGEQDLFCARLDQIIDINHPLVKLGHAIDGGFLEQRFGAMYADGPGRPPLPTRLMAGLAILKHAHDLSDEALRALDREPLLSALLWRGVLPASAPPRPLVTDALAPTHGRGTAQGSGGGGG